MFSGPGAASLPCRYPLPDLPPPVASPVLLLRTLPLSPLEQRLGPRARSRPQRDSPLPGLTPTQSSHRFVRPGRRRAVGDERGERETRDDLARFVLVLCPRQPEHDRARCHPPPLVKTTALLSYAPTVGSSELLRPPARTRKGEKPQTKVVPGHVPLSRELDRRSSRNVSRSRLVYGGIGGRG